MTEIELSNLVRKIQLQKCETNTIELKAANVGCPQKIYATLSAFSNQDQGGIIIFGIEENHYSIIGVYDPQDLQKKINEQCKQMVPQVRPVFTVCEIEGKYLVSAEIPGIDISERPCYYGGVGRIKGSYVRIGDSDEPMSEYEVYSYESFRKKYEDDVRVNYKADMKAIDTKALNHYLDTIKSKSPKLSLIEDRDILKFLNMIVDDKPTLVCILLFSLYPQMFYPQYTINAMVVMGYEKGDVDEEGARFIDNKRIEGTLNEMLEETIKFLTKNMKVKTIIDRHSGKRIDKTEYPIIAIREALLNAFLHRDYSIHTQSMPIEVLMFKDRLEVINPGGLYGRLTIDKLGKVQPDTRNPVLVCAMETLGYTENRYSGIPTIYKVMREANMKPPIFKNSRSDFKITFYNDEKQDPGNTLGDLMDKSNDLLEFCLQARTREEIANFLGVGTIHWVMRQYVNPLLEKGMLKMTKPDVPKSKYQKYYTDL